MKIQIITGVMVLGNAIFPKTGEGKSAKDTIIDVPKIDAKALIDAGQAIAAPKDATVTVRVLQSEEESALDKFFGDDEE